MVPYIAPTKDIEFAMEAMAHMADIGQMPQFEEATPDLVEAVLEEAGKLASEVLAPLNKTGDTQGSHLNNGKIEVPEGFAEAYKQYVQGGWMGIGQEVEYGGQGLPHLIYSAVAEMWNASNMSFALNPLLTTGAIEALTAHGSEELKQTYLTRMVSGDWSGTMNLTESQAGSDLAAVRAKAVPNGDHYLISGQKIFITWGDHELTENVIHLVLARLPDAPEGVKGISLFLVPKYLVNEDGTIGERNDVYPVSVEHKMGVHASPTCVMGYGDNGGAVGYLVGEKNNGLSHMFVMMNRARLAVAVQGVAIADRAYQQAVAYARDRVQGYASGQDGRVAIIQHADVRRMLLLMRSLTEAARGVSYMTAAALDLSHNEADAAAAEHYEARLELLVPIAKGWCTEIAQEVTSLGVQIHGGMGFIEETGAAQHFRDARITTIYEGTTGIQALDLVGRKIMRDRGAALESLLGEMQASVSAMDGSDPDMARLQSIVGNAVAELARVAAWMSESAGSDPDLPGSIAVNLMMMLGTVIGGWELARGAVVAKAKLAAGDGDREFYGAKVAGALFYADHVMPRAKAYAMTIMAGAQSTMDYPVEQL